MQRAVRLQSGPEAELRRRALRLTGRVLDSASGLSSEEVTLNWNKWVRQTHRCLSIAFTVAVIINIVAVVQAKYTSRVGLLAVFPLPCSCSPVCTCSCCRMRRSGAAGDAPTERAAV
jgi:hypothetical protein